MATTVHAPLGLQSPTHWCTTWLVDSFRHPWKSGAPRASGNVLTYHQRLEELCIQNLNLGAPPVLRIIMIELSCRCPIGVEILRNRSSTYNTHNLVDPASSHMLVSKIKPCMSKCKSTSAKLWMAHYNSYNFLVGIWIFGYPRQF